MFRSDPGIYLCADLVPGFAITQKSKFHIFKVLIEKICSIKSGIGINVKKCTVYFCHLYCFWIRVRIANEGADPGSRRDILIRIHADLDPKDLIVDSGTLWSCICISQYRYFFCSLPLQYLNFKRNMFGSVRFRRPGT